MQRGRLRPGCLGRGELLRHLITGTEAILALLSTPYP